VASLHLGGEDRDKFAKAILSMHLVPEGRKILHELGFDRFIQPPEDWFGSLGRIEKMLALLAEYDRGFEQF